MRESYEKHIRTESQTHLFSTPTVPYIAGTNTKKGEDITMIKQIYSTMKDNADDSIIFYFTTWLFDPCTLQILIRHLFDNRGELTLPDEVLDEIARCFLPNILDFIYSDIGKDEFEKWKAKQDAQKAAKEKAKEEQKMNRSECK